jgi:hypothetical protein
VKRLTVAARGKRRGDMGDVREVVLDPSKLIPGDELRRVLVQLDAATRAALALSFLAAFVDVLDSRDHEAVRAEIARLAMRRRDTRGPATLLDRAVRMIRNVSETSPASTVRAARRSRGASR